MTKRDEILEVALKIFAKKGYENTTLDEIAKEVGITKPAIYYHFKNKNELYNFIFQEHFKRLSFTKKESLEEDIRAYIDTFGDFFIENPFIAKLFSKELSSEAEHLTDDTVKIVSRSLRHLMEILKDSCINPFFIQTLIVSSFTTYINTLNLRDRISNMIKNEKLIANFDIKREILKMVILYIKANR